MRLSIDDRDGLNPRKRDLCQRAIIVFKGKVIKYVLEADEEQGFVRVYKLDEDGYPIIGSDGELIQLIWHGRVRIIDPLNTDLAGIYLK